MPTVPEIITESVIKQLEQGVAPWRKPWSTSVPRNLISKKPYRGLNVFMLATQGYGQSVLGHVQSSQAIRRTRSARREKHSGFVLEDSTSTRRRTATRTANLRTRTSVIALATIAFSISSNATV